MEGRAESLQTALARHTARDDTARVGRTETFPHGAAEALLHAVQAGDTKRYKADRLIPNHDAKNLIRAQSSTILPQGGARAAEAEVLNQETLGAHGTTCMSEQHAAPRAHQPSRSNPDVEGRATGSAVQRDRLTPTVNQRTQQSSSEDEEYGTQSWVAALDRVAQ